MKPITRIMEFQNMHRLLVILHNDGLYHWTVSSLDGGAYWTLGGSTDPVSLDEALRVGRVELAVWSENAEAWLS